MSFVEALPLAAAVICVTPVGVGFVVTRWVKFWNRADRDGGVV